MVKPTLSTLCHGISMSSTYAKPMNHNQPTAQDTKASAIVINTRPVERAAPLTQYLRAAGMAVVDIPMLTLQSRSTTEQDMTLMRQWLAEDYKTLVIVSPTAAASGLAVWQALVAENNARDNINSDEVTDVSKLKDVKAKVSNANALKAENVKINRLKAPSYLIAVGEATAAVLNEAKVEADSYQVRQPKVANNEGMLAMPEIEHLKAGDKLLVWRGLGGRRLLVDTLQARGVHIDSIAWYERTMPTDATAQYEQWLQDFLSQNRTPQNLPKPIVVVSSGTAFEHWASIVQSVSKTGLKTKAEGETIIQPPLQLTDFSYVVLGERLANIVAEQQLSYWRVEDLAPKSIVAAISASPISIKSNDTDTET